ncbi:MAG: cytidine deaminase [Candidatus Muiribacterium halophilum]|uniref:Cytidine deaminase n=1 Tax=Muiribacterium halophilum TaxID=2053465 RepID=A0A2N5ZE99_MUIH1|nr:MAG: cytidine deaminase [Candidatus Muirbacterium halophilum]
MNIDFDQLYSEAKKVLNPWKLSEFAESGGVGAALLTKKGNIYTGVCIDTSSSMGGCAEHFAAGTMINAGENEIVAMIAVNWDGKIFPPCGRCREFISQLSPENLNTQVKVSENIVLSLKDLLPYDYKDLCS